jgi:asparagine synthase (glutamine-hydrolysing)
MSDPAVARDALAAEIRASATSLARTARRPLLELSGGLDSSILAACLADRAADLSCVNIYSSASGGDERRYALAMADRIGAALHTVELDAGRVDLHHVAEIRSPLPTANLLHELIDATLIDELGATGADAFFSGGGGDNVFCHLATASPAADALLAGEGLDKVSRIVRDVARLNGCTIWTAAHYAVRKALRARFPHQPRRDLFMSADALANPPDLHRWLEGPQGALPGKREHAASIAFALWNNDVMERSRVAPVRYPLISQPAVELCLSIPSWMWVEGGQNRALAREAFRPVLPDIIVNRRTKGDLTGFMTDVFRKQRLAVRALLLDGRLAKEGVIDREAVEAAFSSEEPPDQMRCGALLTLAKAEVWARSWSA